MGIDAAAILYFFALDLRRYFASQFILRQSRDSKLKLINKRYRDIAALRLVDLVTFITIGGGLLVYLERSLIGVVYALVGIAVLYFISKLSFVSNGAAIIFEQHYEFVCRLAGRLQFALQYVSVQLPQPQKFQSRDELIDVMKALPSTVLPPVERQRMELLLSSSEKTVKDIMTPKRRVTMVEPSSTLGPVVLSDLQKSGHGYFPVVPKKGEPEGVLALGDLADIHQAKQRATVRELMTPHVSWVEEAVSLYALAETFLHEKQYLLLVRDTDANFSGVVTIADLMKHLLGVVKD